MSDTDISEITTDKRLAMAEARDEIDRLKRLEQAALMHLDRYETHRAKMLIGEMERRYRDLDIKLSCWEGKTDE